MLRMLILSFVLLQRNPKKLCWEPRKHLNQGKKELQTDDDTYITLILLVALSSWIRLIVQRFFIRQAFTISFKAILINRIDLKKTRSRRNEYTPFSTRFFLLFINISPWRIHKNAIDYFLVQGDPLVVMLCRACGYIMPACALVGWFFKNLLWLLFNRGRNKIEDSKQCFDSFGQHLLI